MQDLRDDSLADQKDADAAVPAAAGTTMTDLANRTVAAAQQLYGNAAADVTRKAFADRGIL